MVKGREKHEDQCHGFYLDALSMILIPGKTPGSVIGGGMRLLLGGEQGRSTGQGRGSSGLLLEERPFPHQPHIILSISLSLTVDGGS
jgi:hypothetical protein